MQGLTHDTVLQALTAIDALLPAGDRATAAGYTDAAITTYLNQLNVNYNVTTDYRTLNAGDRILFNIRGHWMADTYDGHVNMRRDNSAVRQGEIFYVIPASLTF